MTKPLRHFCIWTLILVYLPIFDSSQSFAQGHDETDVGDMAFKVDYGRFSVRSHDIQFGKEGTRFDLRTDGGQNKLFELYRFQLIKRIQQHEISALYQPIFIDTKEVLRKALAADDTNFEAGKPIDVSYYFPYTRLTYLYLTPWSQAELRVGGSVQIRNASISVTSSDGTLRVFRGDVGSLLLANISLRYKARGFELEGDFAFAGLSTERRERGGYLHDFALSVRKESSKTINLHYGIRSVRGGYAGESSSSTSAPRRYTSNWIDLLAWFIGTRYRF